MRVVGLTGSIGMGKSTTAAMFAERGVPVHDADAAVHRLYRGAAAAPLEAAFPGVTTEGIVDRSRLSERVVGEPGALDRLEAIVHPLVRESEREFLRRASGEGRPLVVLDIPLLFETGGRLFETGGPLFETGGVERVDAIVVVSAPASVQRARVLARPAMTEKKFEALLARQTPDEEKRKRAHFLVNSGDGPDRAGRDVDAILRALAFTG